MFRTSADDNAWELPDATGKRCNGELVDAENVAQHGDLSFPLTTNGEYVQLLSVTIQVLIAETNRFDDVAGYDDGHSHAKRTLEYTVRRSDHDGASTTLRLGCEVAKLSASEIDDQVLVTRTGDEIGDATAIMQVRT